MIRVSSTRLRSGELSLLKRYAYSVLRRFVKPSVVAKTNITIKIDTTEELSESEDRADLTEYGAWTTYDGIENEMKKFTIILNAYHYNSRAKKPWIRVKQIMVDLGHELVHIKQYLNNELFDYVSGDVRFKGTVFGSRHVEDEESYYNSPWEIEAYGREWGLYKMFANKLKNEAKAAKG
jgi:hypothetical protein